MNIYPIQIFNEILLCTSIINYIQGDTVKLTANIVTYRPVAKQTLCKQRPLLGNARNNGRTVFSVVRAEAVSGQRLSKHVPEAMDTNTTTEERCFLCCPCRDVITRTVGATSSVDSSVVSSISQRATA
jgi:hypothetical protein